jgi:hypothetical protein
MTRADLYGGLLLAAFFAAALLEAFTFQYGTEFSPGPGFAPVWLSGLGLCVSLLIAGYALRAMRRREGAQATTSKLEKHGLVRVVLTLLALAAMVVLVEPLGLVVALLLYLLFLTIVVQRHSLAIAIGTSIGTVAFVYLVFVRFLDVPVPKGPLGL